MVQADKIKLKQKVYMKELFSFLSSSRTSIYIQIYILRKKVKTFFLEKALGIILEILRKRFSQGK